MQTSPNQGFNRATWLRFIAIAKPFFSPKCALKRLHCSLSLLPLSVAVTKLNVWMSEIAGSYMNALTNKQSDIFYSSIGLFAFAVLCTAPVGVMYRYAEDAFALLWRNCRLSFQD